MKTVLSALALLAASVTIAHADIEVYNIACENNDFIQIRTEESTKELESVTINDSPTMIGGISHQAQDGKASTIYQFSATGSGFRPYALMIGSGNEPMKLYSNGEFVSTCRISQ